MAPKQTKTRKDGLLPKPRVRDLRTGSKKPKLLSAKMSSSVLMGGAYPRFRTEGASTGDVPLVAGDGEGNDFEWRFGSDGSDIESDGSEVESDVGGESDVEVQEDGGQWSDVEEDDEAVENAFELHEVETQHRRARTTKLAAWSGARWEAAPHVARELSGYIPEDASCHACGSKGEFRCWECSRHDETVSMCDLDGNKDVCE